MQHDADENCTKNEEKKKEKRREELHRSLRIPNPGPLGGSMRDVRPARGSDANRPFLFTFQTNQKAN